MIIIIVGVLLLVPNVNVSAKTLNDLYSQLNTLEKKQAATDNSKKLTESEINKLNNDIANLTASIKRTSEEVAQAEKDIIATQDKIEEKKKETNDMMKYLQVSTGENVYLEYLFEADTYTDFIYRYSIVKQMTNYNNELMDELTKLVQELEDKKKTLAEKQQSMNAQRQELEAKNAKLHSNLSELTSEGTTIAQDIAAVKKEIEKYKAICTSDSQDVTTCGKKTSSGGWSQIPNASGWTYPLASGCVTSEYVGNGHRNDWSGGVSGHHGIDLGCNAEGTPIYAAAPGTVARVVYKSSCGGNMVWVYHIVNGVPYTTVYMHMLSIRVSEGQAVTTSSVVGTVGGGSTMSYDACTGGSHLHFGMASGHNAVGFNSYSFNPRKLFSFPGIYNGYFKR